MRLKSVSIAAFLALLCFFRICIYAQVSHEAEIQQYAQAGQQALASGQMTEARKNFEQLVKLEPSIAEAHATLGAIYFQQHDFELAAREVRTAQKLKPSLPKLDSLLGLSLAELGQFNDAVPMLEKGFKQTGDEQVKRLCGLQLLRAYTNLHRDAEAVETALALNKDYPDDPEIMYHTGRIYGNYAYLVMEGLQEKAPDSIWRYEAKADANESQKDYDAALAAYNQVLLIDAKRPGVHYRMGRVYLSRYNDTHKPEDRESAKKEFAAEIQNDPTSGNAVYELAQMAAEDNDLETARKGFEAIIAHFPSFEQALVGLGGIYLQTQQGAKAVELLRRATKLQSDDEVAWYRLSQAERAAGNRAEAQKAVETFRKLHDASAAVHRPPTPDTVTPQQLGSDATTQ